jgi:hypothetical protein
MDYLHLSTSDVANLKESWVVLEDNISKVRKEVIVLEDNISNVIKEVLVLGNTGGQHIQGRQRSHSPG